MMSSEPLSTDIVELHWAFYFRPTPDASRRRRLFFEKRLLAKDIKVALHFYIFFVILSSYLNQHQKLIDIFLKQFSTKRFWKRKYYIVWQASSFSSLFFRHWPLQAKWEDEKDAINRCRFGFFFQFPGQLQLGQLVLSSYRNSSSLLPAYQKLTKAD